jgi:hypothetical protein
VKAIVGQNAVEIAPRLLGFLSLARQTALRSDVLSGEAGELCVLPSEGENWNETGPRHSVEVRVLGDRVEFDGGGFTIVECRRAQGALEIATSVAVKHAPPAHWRQRVLLALRDEAALGRVVRALLERGRDRLDFARVEPGSVHPGTEWMLLVRDVPLYVVLEILEEGLGHAFYEASHAQERDKLLGLFLPWGQAFPLVAALGARLERPCVRQVSGHLVALDLDRLASIDGVLLPELGATVASASFVPHGELRVRVPLRLQALDKAQVTERPELWRVGPEALDELASELACAEDRLVNLSAQVVRLSDDQAPSVFIWSPTGLDEDGERLNFSTLPGFARARRRVANLLLPSRHAVLPTLSDETLRSVFGLRQGVMTVVDMAPGGKLVQYHLQLEHFQPLRRSLVEYFLHIHEQPLLRVCESAQFEFEPITLPPSAAEESEAPSEARPKASLQQRQPDSDADSETEQADASAPLPAPEDAPVAVPAAPPAIHWPSRLTQATQELIADPGDDDAGLDFFEASLAMMLRQDARMALLRFLPRCEATQARSLLTAALGLAGRAQAMTVMSALGSDAEPFVSVEAALEQVLTLALVALDSPQDLPADVRRGLARLPARLRALGLPRLTWTAARLVWQLTHDSQILEETRLWVEPGLLSVGVRLAYPPRVVHELEERNRHANRTAVRTFAEAASLGPAELVFLRLAYALRLVVLGGGIDGELLSELTAELESARDKLGASAGLAQSALRTLEQARSHGLSSLGQFDLDANLRTVLIEEGFLLPVNESAETRVLRRGDELAAASAADAADQAVALFDEVWLASGGGLEAMFGVVSRLRLAGQQDALVALQTRVGIARSANDVPRRTAVVLAGLAAGLASAVDPRHDPGSALGELVTMSAGLPTWDQSLALRAVLLAVEPLPVETRRVALVPLYRALRERKILLDWSGAQTIRVEEQRVLFRLVNLLVVPVDETPQAEHLCRAEGTTLREMIQIDLTRARIRA